jgi:hypothetical protein
LSPHFAPWVSDNWTTYFHWTGLDVMPEGERVHLQSIAKKAADRGVKLRFWGTPDTPAVWKELREAGVTLISTDDLTGYRHFADRVRGAQ